MPRPEDFPRGSAGFDSGAWLAAEINALVAYEERVQAARTWSYNQATYLTEASLVGTRTQAWYNADGSISAAPRPN